MFEIHEIGGVRHQIYQRIRFWALTEIHFQWSAVARASCWKCSSINAFIPQWNFKRMHSILIIILKSHQNLK
jgi:hypothetical protein